MNYFIIIWDGCKFDDVNDKIDQAIKCQIINRGNWSVILYCELEAGKVDKDLKEYKSDILKQLSKKSVQKLFISFHFAVIGSRPSNLMEKRYEKHENYFKERLTQMKGSDIQVWGFNSEGEPARILKKLPNAVASNSIESLLEEFTESLSQSETKQLNLDLSILKHRIVDLFISMDVDFQGIDTVNENSTRALEYLKAVLVSHEKPNYYQGKFNKLHEYVGGKQQSIREILKSSKITENDADWKSLLALSGLEDNQIIRFSTKLDKMDKNRLNESDFEIK